MVVLIEVGLICEFRLFSMSLSPYVYSGVSILREVISKVWQENAVSLIVNKTNDRLVEIYNTICDSVRINFILSDKKHFKLPPKQWWLNPSM